MPNIKSSKKRVVTSEKARLRNVACRSELKTAVSKVLAAVESKAFAEAQELFRLASSTIAKAVNKGVLKKGTASRKIQRLAHKVKPAAQAA